MISEWEKREDYWTNIGSPDFDRDLRYRGYLEIRRHGLSGLSGLKKNCMWLLRKDAPELLRQDGATNTGLIVWGCPDISGSGSQACSVQEVRKSEAGETSMVGEQSILHKAVFLLCREEVPKHDPQGCCKGTETGLAFSEDLGEGIHAGAASAQSGSSAACNWHRRNIFTKGTHLSDRGKRFRAGAADLVWRERPVRGEHGYILRVAWT